MRLDDVVPTWDATRIEHRVVGASRDSVFAAARELDFLAVPREIPAVRGLFAIRAAAERAVTVARRRATGAETVPPTLRLADLGPHGEWVGLGEVPGAEIAFGAVGRFWAGETAWQTIDADGFATFAEPGYARIGCNLSLRDYGPQTLVSYEARTVATDAEARRAFLRYWHVVGPFVGVVMRGTLRLLDRLATEAAPGRSTTDPAAATIDPTTITGP